MNYKKSYNMKILSIDEAQKRAKENTSIIITGVTGQDGSLMVDYLLANTSYMLFGGVRRLSVSSHNNISHLIDNARFACINFDLIDAHTIENVISTIKPAYFINLAAQSFVKSSWDLPAQTWEVNSTGVLHILEAIHRHVPTCRVYNAGSSEEFGNVLYSPQDEFHSLRPLSPYGASKAAARHLIKVYRESYKMYAIQGWLFNHECLTEHIPIIIKYISSGLIDVKPISELVPHRKNPKKGRKYTSTSIPDFLVWDGGKWSKVLTRTATWNDEKNDKKIKRVLSRGGYYEATSDHISFTSDDKEIPTHKLMVNDTISLKPLPGLTSEITLTEEEAEFLGMMVAEGCIKKSVGTIINKDKSFIDRVEYLWKKISCGYTTIAQVESGYKPGEFSFCLSLCGDISYLNFIKQEIYTDAKYKRIPLKILNSSYNLIMSFLRGYNRGDGTKTCNQNGEFQCFTTNSSVLAAGLWLLSENVLKVRTILNVEYRNNAKYYKINLNVFDSNKEKHLIESRNQIKSIINEEYKGWLFDLETESGTFSAGIGNTWVHNSPRRGEEFVTRKITKGVARIAAAIAKARRTNTDFSFEPLELGNVNAKRDWSDAEDCVDAIWRMLNQDKYNEQIKNLLSFSFSKYGKFSVEFTEKLSLLLKEYVVGSGESYTIGEFVELAFKYIGINGKWAGSGIDEKFIYESGNISIPPGTVLAKINTDFYRPVEVENLCGDNSAIKRELKWKPKTTFKQLVEKMIDHDLT